MYQDFVYEILNTGYVIHVNQKIMYVVLIWKGFFCDKTVITMYVQQNKGIFWSLTLCECQVALVCQWGVYQFSSIALVLVSVLKLSIHHLYATQAFSVHVESAIYQAITPDYTIWNFHT